MKKLIMVVATVFMFLLGGDVALARGGGHHSKGKRAPSSSVSGGRVYVKGYTRKDGTYVAPHYRSAPGTARTGFTTPRVRTSTIRFHQAHYATGYVGARDTNGRIVRSEAAKREFMKMTGFPHGRPGYVVDHITALKHGGADAPSNMQWQTIEDAKAKDRWE